jgi:hypothetical protein
VIRRTLIATGLAAAASLFGGCAGDYRFRYRLTVRVNVDGETVAGESVRELAWHERNRSLAGMDRSHFLTRGEAVVVDLASRGLLIATLQKWREGPDRYIDPNLWTPAATLERRFGPDRASWARNMGVPVKVMPEDMPVMVTFTDPQSPATVGVVDPMDLSKSFGREVSLQSVVVEITRAGVTRGPILRALPWLKTWDRGWTLSGHAGTRSNAAADRLSRASFTFGVD